jgi:RNA polymerase sigma-70 factor, ECF subfamily
VPTVFLASDEGDPGERVRPDSHPVPVEAGTSPSIDERDVLALWRLLRRLGVSNADADDATQEVYLIVAERRAEILPGKERAFVYGAALRVAHSRLRRRDRSVELDEPSTAPDDAPGIEDLLDQREARRILDELLEQMPFELRAVFVLFELEELSTIEIGEALEIPRGTAASRLRRAREDFQTRVARFRARLAHRGTKP